MGVSAIEYEARDLSSGDVVAVMLQRASKEPSPTPHRSTPHSHAPSQSTTKMLHAVAHKFCQFPVLAIMFTFMLSVPPASGAPLPAAQPPEHAPWHWLEPVIGALSAIATVILAAFLGWAIESFRNRRRRSATSRRDGVLLPRMPPRPLSAEAARVETEYWSVLAEAARLEMEHWSVLAEAARLETEYWSVLAEAARLETEYWLMSLYVSRTTRSRRH